jgi:opacity protein-like surface antigen
MKKVVCVMILGVVALGAAWALDVPEMQLSAGGGAYFSLGIPLDDKKSGDKMSLTPGVWGFFDATFVEADLAVGYSLRDKLNSLGIEISVLGKFPFALAEGLSLFPLVGVKYTIIPYAAYDGTSLEETMKQNFLGFQVGAGVDYDFSETMFLRGELLCDLDLFSFDKDASGDNAGLAFLGPRVKVGVGFKF